MNTRSDKDVVIARLYREIQALEEERDAVLFTFNQADAECAKLRTEVDRMTDQAIKFRDMAQDRGFLLSRAADALALSTDRQFHINLIAELRKAAE